MLKLLELQTEYKKNPLGMDELAPRFSYKLEGDSLCQKARKITIWSENGECVWENFAETPQTNQIVYMGKTLRPFTRYFWSVTVTDEKGEIFASSGEDYFETGFLGKKWESKWITSYPASGSDTLWSVQRLFRKFTIPGKVRKARFYTTALGLYELRLDGKKVTEDIFTPGWTDYTARVQYQAYDVTTSLTEGDHNWGVFLASGWFSGKISCNWNYGSSGYGRHALFRGELHITYEDGSTEEALFSDFTLLTTRALTKYDRYVEVRYTKTMDKYRVSVTVTTPPVEEPNPPEQPSEPELPETPDNLTPQKGGNGWIIAVVGGIAVLGGAVAVFFVLNKKGYFSKKNKEKTAETITDTQENKGEDNNA